MKITIFICLMAFACQKSEVSNVAPQADKNFLHPDILGSWTVKKMQTINCGPDNGTSYATGVTYYFSNLLSDNGWYYCNPNSTSKTSQQYKIVGDSILFLFTNSNYPYSSYWKISNDSLIFVNKIGILISGGSSYSCANMTFTHK